jgi:hypothetical protein
MDGCETIYWVNTTRQCIADGVGCLQYLKVFVLSATGSSEMKVIHTFAILLNLTLSSAEKTSASCPSKQGAWFSRSSHSTIRPYSRSSSS